MYYQNDRFAIDTVKLTLITSLLTEFDHAQLGRITPRNARIILAELGVDETDAHQLVLGLGPIVRCEVFLESLRQYFGEEQARLEMTNIFETIKFMGGEDIVSRIGKKAVAVSLTDIQNTANELQEALSTEDIIEMLSIVDGPLTLPKFIQIMKKTHNW